MSSNKPDISSTSTSEESPDTPTIEKHLVKVASDMVLACNSRHWDPEAYPWTQISPHFHVGPTFATLPASMDFKGFLQNFSRMYADKPEFYVRPISITAQVSEKAREAQVFANFENFNYTPGVIRYSVGLWEFREVEKGKWLCVWYRSLPGPTG